MPAAHPALPVTPEDLAAAAASAVAAGAESLHVHPKDSHGADTLDPAVVAAVISAIRAAVPGVPVGTTTGAWTVPNAMTRLATISAWEVLPDFASVNWHEDGAEELVALLLDRGVGVEAGVWTGPIAAEFTRNPLAPRCLRVMGEPMEQDPQAAIATGKAIVVAVAGLDLPILLHGQDAGAWPVLRNALAAGLDTRIGLEDVLTLPNGRLAPDNATLVRAARELS